MRKTFIFLSVLILAGIAAACSDSPATTIESGSPMDAYRNLYNAVKSKDTGAIKAVMSKGSIGLVEAQAAQQKVPVEKVYENGLTATTFSETLPEMRDQRIDGSNAAVEVWNARNKVWEDLPFIIEDGTWKFAIGDAFSGRFKSPGPGRAAKEAEAANAISNRMIRIDPKDANANSQVIFNGNSNTNINTNSNTNAGPPAK